METFETACPRQDHVLLHPGIRPEAVVYTGDLAARGEPEAYRKLRDAAEALTGRTVVNSVVPIGFCPRVEAFVPAEEASRRLSGTGVRIPPSTSLPSPAAAGARTGNPQGRAQK